MERKAAVAVAVPDAEAHEGPSSGIAHERSAAPARVEAEQGTSPVEADQAAQGRLPPSSSKALVFPARPGYGTLGRRCRVRANHFLVQVADKEIYHYDVCAVYMHDPSLFSFGFYYNFFHFFEVAELSFIMCAALRNFCSYMAPVHSQFQNLI